MRWPGIPSASANNRHFLLIKMWCAPWVVHISNAAFIFPDFFYPWRLFCVAALCLFYYNFDLASEIIDGKIIDVGLISPVENFDFVLNLFAALNSTSNITDGMGMEIVIAKVSQVSCQYFHQSDEALLFINQIRLCNACILLKWPPECRCNVEYGPPPGKFQQLTAKRTVFNVEFWPLPEVGPLYNDTTHCKETPIKYSPLCVFRMTAWSAGCCGFVAHTK